MESILDNRTYNQ